MWSFSAAAMGLSVVQIHNLLTLLLLFVTIPVTSNTAEISSSSFRRFKTFIRTTLTQKRLNHVALLHYHRQQAETIDLEDCKNFFKRNELKLPTCEFYSARAIAIVILSISPSVSLAVRLSW